MFTFDDLATIITAGYILAFLVVSGLVLWLARPLKWKLIGFAVVCALFGYPLLSGHLEQKERQEKNDAIAARFMQLCKEKAGDRIVRTVEGVDGFYIMRPRKPTKNHQEYLDQFWMGDPYGHSDYEAEVPEKAFLSDRSGRTTDSTKTITPITGYEFIELPNPEYDVKGEGSKYVRILAIRRTTDKEGRQSIEYEKTLTDMLRSRYGLNWEDISTPGDRKIWIAGGRMQVINLETSEVVAERTGYVIDREQGARYGGGIPWLLAQRSACPPFENDFHKSKEFLAKVLKSSREIDHGR